MMIASRPVSQNPVAAIIHFELSAPPARMFWRNYHRTIFPLNRRQTLSLHGLSADRKSEVRTPGRPAADQ